MKKKRRSVVFGGTLLLFTALMGRVYPVQAEIIEPAYHSDLARVTELFPATKDQGNYSACWSFSAVGLAEFDLICDNQLADKTIDLSELQLAYATYHHSEDPLGGTKGDSYEITGEDNYLECGGNLEYAARSLMQWKGLLLEEELPYEKVELADTYPETDYYTKAVAHLENVYKIPILDNPDAVKEQVVKHGAVGISYYSPATAGESAEFKRIADYKGEKVCAAYCDDEGKKANHSVNVVGWDDEFPASAFKKTPAEDGAWLIRNSWSKANRYEDGSYFWLSYYDRTIENLAWVYDFAPADHYDHNYQYDGCILAVDGSTVLDSLKFEAVSNIFEAKASENEVLKAVSLSFMNRTDVSYTVKIYTDLCDIRNPKSGYLAASVSGKTGFAGYYTVPLAKEVPLKKDTYYAVVVEFDEPGSVDMEFSFNNPISHYKTTAAVEWGQSLALQKGKWKDVWDSCRKMNFGNFCVKAYTDSVDGISLRQVVMQEEKARTKTGIQLRWRRVKQADGYELYRSDSESGTYKKIKTIKSGEKLTYKDKNLSRGKKYYYRIRAFKNLEDGQKIVGKMSAPTEMRTKK